jgi:hypothetical protein
LHAICRGCAALEEAEGADGVYKCPFCEQKCSTPAKDLFVDVAKVAEVVQEQEEIARDNGGGGAAGLTAPTCTVCHQDQATKCVLLVLKIDIIVEFSLSPSRSCPLR